MNGIWAGYIWGEFASHTVRWEPPTNIFVDASLHLYEGPRSGRNHAVAWVRSVAVRDPSTGQTTVPPYEGRPPADLGALIVSPDAFQRGLTYVVDRNTRTLIERPKAPRTTD